MVEALLGERQGSRRAQAIADLTAFEEARLIYERLIANGQAPVAAELAALCEEKAFIHAYVDDVTGAVALHDQAIVIRERLVQQQGRRDLAKCYTNKALALGDLKDNKTAVALFDKAFAIYQRLVYEDGRRESVVDLAWVKVGRATAFFALGKRAKARTDAGEAMAMLKAEIARTGRTDLQRDLKLAQTLNDLL